MENKLSKKQLKLVKILIKLTKEDINNGLTFQRDERDGSKKYRTTVTLRALRSVAATKEYGHTRKKRMNFLRNKYMNRILPHYK